MATAGTTPNFLDKRLPKDDVPEILANILDAQTKSELLGRVLKLSPSRVSGIHMQYKDPEECLFRVIDEFVKQVDPIPTWRVILTALKHSTIRLTGLADDIESKLCPPTICDESKNTTNSGSTSETHHQDWLTSWKTILTGVTILIVLLAVVWSNTDCYQLGLCHSKSLPSVSHFVGREEDIRNITGYLDFYTSDVQVVHIVGPPGFGKSTLAMKIGEIFLRNWVSVHYVDVGQKMVKDIDTLAEKIVLSMVESRKTKVTFSDLEEKIQKQYSKALIILDNCDEILEHSKEEFLGALKSLTALSQKSVRYLLTSQKWVADIGNFRLHAIYNLSSEAAIQLLSTVAPSLTDDQKKQIADLTGNVPLALEVIGAIFRFPDAPTPEIVINGLKEHLLRTLSPTELHSTVDVSIRMAYTYLTPELKQLGTNLSHIPGSFDEISAPFLFGFDPEMLADLVQRSLLQTSHSRQRYHFHQLIKRFFLIQENWTSFQVHFDTQFQLYYNYVLNKIVIAYTNDLVLIRLDEEKENIRHMFRLFKRTKNMTITFNGIAATLDAITFGVLQLRFLPVEIRNISEDMLAVLDSYTPDEQSMVNSFLPTYVNAVLLVGKQQQSISEAAAIKTLTSKRKRVNKGYELGEIDVGTFTKYYSVLAQYYENNGDTDKSARCHTHILKTIHGQLKSCDPRCDYYDISIAYNKIEDKRNGLHFRELSYQHQFQSLDRMKQAKLLLELHQDYLLNNDNEANSVSAMITDEVYPYLMAAEKSEYSMVVYLNAIDFFKAQNLEKHMIQLQMRMIDNAVPCSERKYAMVLSFGEYYRRFKSFSESYLTNDITSLVAKLEFKCAAYYADMANDVFEKGCYHLAIWLGEQSCAYIDKLGEPYTVLKFKPESIIGRSHFMIGKNYSATDNSLKQAVEHINNAIRFEYFSFELRELRTKLCDHILLLNWFVFVNPLIYIRYLLGGVVMSLIKITLFLILFPLFWLETVFQHKEIILNAETGLTEQNVLQVYSDKFIKQWEDKIYLMLIFAGTFLYYSFWFLCCRHCISPFITYNIRILKILIFLSLITSLLILDVHWL